MSAALRMAVPAPSDEAGLLRQHSGLVRRIALHLAARLPASVELDDLIQAGSMGLLDAARHYNGALGASFETYAGTRIRGAMIDELRRTDWAPRSVHQRLREVTQAITQIEQRTGRAARDAEIAAHLSISLSEYHEIVLDASRCQMLSMDGGGDDEDRDEGFEAADETTPMDALQRAQFQRDLEGAIGGLPERERLVMSLYYDQELNLREIGAVLDVSESRVCQIHSQALVRLRSRMTAWADAQA